jgi:protein TonB
MELASHKLAVGREGMTERMGQSTSFPIAVSAPARKIPSSPALMSIFGSEYEFCAVRPKTFAVSFLLHCLVLIALLISGTYFIQRNKLARREVIAIVSDLSPYVLTPATTKAGGGGGGGDRDKLGASRGVLPKFSHDQFTPPMVVVRNEHPKLVVEPTVVVAPELQVSQSVGPLGDPLSNILGPPSNGTGSGGGIGSGSGGGVGSGNGPGVGPGSGGGMGGGVYRVGGGVSGPRVIFAPDPEFSEEARKAKYQGTVVLWAVIGSDGRPRDVRIQRSLGMGLDEKAIEAIRKWRFEPGRKNGAPVSVQVNVEVNFRLY